MNRKGYIKAALTACGALTLLIGLIIWMRQAPGVSAGEITVYKSPTCGCCNKWVSHLRDAGFKVNTINSDDLESIKLSAGVQPFLQSCHTALVDGYVVEGHVPASDIKRLLQERPAVTGLAVPGMPAGSPGMENTELYMTVGEQVAALETAGFENVSLLLEVNGLALYGASVPRTVTTRTATQAD